MSILAYARGYVMTEKLKKIDFSFKQFLHVNAINMKKPTK